MTVDQITAWVRNTQATVTIEAKTQYYNGLTITVIADGRTAQVGPAIGELVEGVSLAIEKWQKAS